MRHVFFSVTFIFLLGLCGFAPAHAVSLSSLKTGQSFFTKGAGVLSADKLKEAGVAEVKTLAGNKEMTLVFLDKNGQILKQFMWQKTSPKNLESFRPSKFRQWYEATRGGAKETLKAKVRQFPFEAMAFFSAIGAINAYDLVFHHDRNPMIMSQFAEGQQDLLTHVSFMAFMAANGLTADPLTEVTRSKALHYFIPYFGMSMGMMASNVVHDLAGSKTLRACAGALLNSDPLKDKMCDEAWDDMNKHWNDKWGQYATSWLSMMGSTALGGAIDWVVSKGVAKAMQFVALEFAFSFGTGGGSIVTRFVWTTVKNVQFLALDFWLRQPIEKLWLNVFGKASELSANAICLGTLHQIFRTQNYPGVHPRKAALDLQRSKLCDETSLEAAVETFSRLSQEWRVENTKEVLTRHMNWQTYLANFASHYRSSRMFYQHLTDKIWQKTYANTAKTPSPLDQIHHFFGIRPDPILEEEPEDIPAMDWTSYLEDKRTLEVAQMKRIAYFADRIQNNWLNVSDQIQQYEPGDQELIRTFAANLISKDPEKVRLALKEMDRVLPSGEPKLAASAEYQHLGMSLLPSDAYLQFMAHVASRIGIARPVSNPGEGFLKAWMFWQGRDYESEAKGQSQAFPERLGNVATPSAAEYMVAAMVKGPDLENGESVIDRNRWSSSMAQFNPPRIILQGEMNEDNPSFLAADLTHSDSIFTKLMSHEKRVCDPAKKVCDLPLWSWIRGAWIRPEVMTKAGNNMAQWWKEKVEPPYLDAWYEFEVEYESVVKDFAYQLFDADSRWSSWSNTSGFSNATLPALEQEREVLLMFLNDALKIRAGRALEVTEAPYRVQTKAAQEMTNLLPELAKYKALWAQTTALLPKINNELSGQMDGEKGVLISRVPNEKLEEAVAKLDESLQMIAQAAVPNSGSRPDDGLILALNKLLGDGHIELLELGLVLNTASYVENHSPDGKVRKARCLKLPSGGGSTPFMAKAPGCP